MKTNVKDILLEASSAVREANIPDHLQTIAFEKAIELLSNNMSSPKRDDFPDLEDEVKPSTLPQTDNGVEKLSKTLSLTREDVQKVYDLDGDDIHLAISPKVLSDNKAGATKEIALLVAAGRQGAGIEERTSAQKIREVCVDFNRYDGSNFAATLKELKGDFVITGSNQKREVKITRGGFEKARDIVKRLTGVES